jgi:hypothetical protein
MFRHSFNAYTKLHGVISQKTVTFILTLSPLKSHEKYICQRGAPRKEVHAYQNLLMTLEITHVNRHGDSVVCSFYALNQADLVKWLTSF